jgi:hypothetical protein
MHKLRKAESPKLLSKQDRASNPITNKTSTKHLSYGLAEVRKMSVDHGKRVQRRNY